MSDDFDKEAEREKLREQFEAEQQRREATQQMSELLLKGATMTNKHCDDCGDPVFRHEGQEFCANCQTVAVAGDEAASADDPAPGGEAAEDAAARGQSGEAGGTPDGTDEVPVEPQSRTDDAASSPDRSTSEGSDERTPSDAVEASRGATAGGGESTADAPRQSSPDRGRPDRSGATRRDAGSGTVDEAVDAPAALQRSLEKFSRLAAETDDPREAKHHLEAAREAAEALAALRK